MLSKLAIPTLIVACIAVAVLMRRGQDEVAHPRPAELIVTGTLEEASGLLTRIKAGEDFGTLASKYSIDLSAGDGGYLGNGPNKSGTEVRETLRGLKPGAVSKVFKTPAGYAILKALNDSDAVKIADDYEVRRIRSNLADVLLAPDESGYGEFLQAFRNKLPASDLLVWQKDLKSVCATRQQAPRDAIRALQKLIADEGGHMDPGRLAYSRYALGQLWLSQTDFDQAIRELEAAYRIGQTVPNNDVFVWHMEEVLGINYLHRSAFTDPAVDPLVNAARIFPSHPGDLHTRQNDNEKAIQYLTKCLTRTPYNAELQWLLNLAYMTVDKYPSQVPKEFLIPPSAFESKENLGRFIDVAPSLGLATYGNAGGVIMDDFDNDGFLDIVTSQIDDCAPLRYSHNNGDGTFTDRTRAAGLEGQMGGLNMIQGDYNNDGCMDILVLRGGWEFPRRHSLLRNNCDGTFTDVTAQSGLMDGPILSSNSAVWADIDNDGYLDLFFANEHGPSQLFLNKGDGTFVDISHRAGIDRSAISKAVVSADYDHDGYPDFYVSNYNGLNFLYHNNGNRTFTEVSRQAGVSEPLMSFAAWFFDYDNDGWPDLFVTDYFLSVDEVAKSYMGLPRRGETLKLYRNLGNGKFKDVTADVNLDRVFMPMGSNFGDIDNDGFLDIYLGNGNPSYASLLPSVLLHNQDGKHFTDITASSGTGALAKGHGVAFGDLNNDGDEDLFAVLGGPQAGDRSFSRLFVNPGKHGNDWITVHLVGVKSNRGANGAQITTTVVNEGEKPRTIVRTVGSGGSFGASPWQQHIGLGKAARIENLEIWWPTSRTRQRFDNVGVNQFVEIKEFEKNFTKLTRRSFQLGGPVRARETGGASGR